MMAIPESFLDELIAHTDLVDLVSESVRLQKKGRNYWGLCPFHGEKTPSFSVSMEKQIYKCFGCGKGGGAINFVMELEHLPFPDAVALLAKRAGLEMPLSESGSGQGQAQRKRLWAINRQAAHLFHQMLLSPQGQEGLHYLQHRGLSPKTIKRFGLGFALPSWEGLIQAMAPYDFDKRDLLDAGLAVSNPDGHIYDRFRNRIIFPILDLRGEVIGFGGRVMDDSTPKYLNSPETLVYHKNRSIFGLNVAKQSRSQEVILTEGYMDTIALHQAGFSYAVASLGTALTPEHAQLLARYFQRAILAYDSDTAGVAAAQRAIPLLERAGLAVRVLQIPGAKDPDAWIQAHGPQGFAQLLKESQHHIDYQLTQLQRQFHLEEDAQKVAFLQQAAQFLASLTSPIEREIYGTKAAHMAGVSPETMAREVETWFQRRMHHQKREVKGSTPQLIPSPPISYENMRSARAEEGVIRLLLLDSSLLPLLEDLSPHHFSSPLLGRTLQLILDRARENLSIQLPSFSSHFSQEEMNHLSYIITQPELMTKAQQSLQDYIAIIRTENLKRNCVGDQALLSLAQRKQLEKKAYMEDKP